MKHNQMATNNTSLNNASFDLGRIAIIGGGTMGQGISQAAAKRGIEVLLIEKDEKSLQKAMNIIIDSLDREIARWAMTEAEKKAIISRIKPEVGLENVTDQPFVLEVVSENYDLKKGIFVELCNKCTPEVIFITNTSIAVRSSFSAKARVL